VRARYNVCSADTSGVALTRQASSDFPSGY
jgi:hypothetical protein